LFGSQEWIEPVHHAPRRGKSTRLPAEVYKKCTTNSPTTSVLVSILLFDWQEYIEPACIREG